MQPMFEALLDLLKEPLRPERAVKTDHSILLIYPPEKELDFREQFHDNLLPRLEAQGIPFQLLDLTGFLFHGLSSEEMNGLEEDEFDGYRWMLQGLSRRVEAALQARISAMADEHPESNVIVSGTVAVHPLVSFGEVLKGLRDVQCRMALAFPGEERGGKLHFMNQPDGGNYLAIKLYWTEGAGR